VGALKSYGQLALGPIRSQLNSDRNSFTMVPKGISHFR